MVVKKRILELQTLFQMPIFELINTGFWEDFWFSDPYIINP